jgi:hypothetical protein
MRTICQCCNSLTINERLKMKKYSSIIIVFGLACLCNLGCYSAADEYIIDHTEHDWYDDTPDGFVIDFLMEEADDVSKCAVSSQDLLKINKIVYEYTGNRYDDLKSITLWVSASERSWDAFNNISPDGSSSYADTAFVFYDNSTLDAFVLAVNWDVWINGSWHDIVHYYVHELVHFVSSQEQNGDSDHGHRFEEYWGKNGLLDQLLDAIGNL